MIKRDCYFHSEWHDMGAIIENCKYSKDLEDDKAWSLKDADCDNCPYYITKTKTDEIIRDYIKNER